MLLLLDANVLIDYAKTDPRALARVVQALGPVFVATPVLDEVQQLTEDDARALGITLVEPETELLIAAAEVRGRLSFQDQLCLLLARAQGWTCVTNDKALHVACAAEGVPCMWGLHLLLRLVEAGAMATDEAINMAEAIRASNPTHVKASVIERFREQLRGGPTRQ
jgi:predicted nucleic acid-binding protein